MELDIQDDEFINEEVLIEEDLSHIPLIFRPTGTQDLLGFEQYSDLRSVNGKQLNRLFTPEEKEWLCNEVDTTSIVSPVWFEGDEEVA